MHAILGQKKHQTQKFREDGKRIPVTVVEVVNNPVIALKTMEKDGYWAVQLGYATQKNPNKPQAGHTKGAAVAAPRFLREVRMSGGENLPSIGDQMALATVLKPGDIIDVTGRSKGKGFAGGVKRYHFQGGPATHGQSDRHRAPGSIGSGTTPGRVYKGKRMAGKMGGGQITVRNVMVAAIDGNTLWIDGLVPGAPEDLLMITKVGEAQHFVPVIGMSEKAQVEETPVEEVEVAEALEEETHEEEKAEEFVEEKAKEAQVEAEALDKQEEEVAA